MHTGYHKRKLCTNTKMKLNVSRNRMSCENIYSGASPSGILSFEDLKFEIYNKKKIKYKNQKKILVKDDLHCHHTTTFSTPSLIPSCITLLAYNDSYNVTHHYYKLQTHTFVKRLSISTFYLRILI